MRLLLDSCISGGLKAALEAGGHDVSWVGDWTHDPGDEEILSRAQAEGRVVVTLDKDFGELAIVRAQAHSGIVRLSNISLRRQAEAILRILNGHGDRLRRGAVVTAEPGRLRVRLQEEP